MHIIVLHAPSLINYCDCTILQLIFTTHYTYIETSTALTNYAMGLTIGGYDNVTLQCLYYEETYLHALVCEC